MCVTAGWAEALPVERDAYQDATPCGLHEFRMASASQANSRVSARAATQLNRVSLMQTRL